MKIKNFFLLIILFSFTFLFVIPKSFNLRNRTSVFKVSSGSNFILDKTINSITGKIIKDSGANISGEDMEFEDGSFQDSGSKIKITGKLNFGETQKIYLDGGKTFQGKRGEVFQTINISGTDNLIEGVLFITSNIELQDNNTAVVFGVRNRLDANIKLNTGSMQLDEDLCFLDNKRIFGPGKVALNGHKLSFGSKDLTWNEKILFENASDIDINSNIYIEDTWTFNGNAVCCANANILSIDCLDGIVVRPNTNLLIRDTVLYGISDTKIRCMTDDATITLQNVKWIQDADFTFSRGSLVFLDNVEFIGNGKKFIYQSQMTSTIKDNAILSLGNNFTFSYAPISGNKNLIEFEADDSSLHLNGGSLYVSYNGLNLLNGIIVSHKDSHIIIEEREWIHSSITGTENFEGITYTNYDYSYGTSGGVFIGNGDSDSDFKINILTGSQLNIDRGTLYYNNKNSSSYVGINELSFFKINSDAHLSLEQTLDVAGSKIVLSRPSCLITASDTYLLGPTFFSE